MIAGPLVLETLFKHFLNPSQASRGIKHKEAREDDLMYDEGPPYSDSLVDLWLMISVYPNEGQ